MPNDVKPNVAHAELIRFIDAAYRAAGIPQADAAKAAELMAASDISGADGHGVFRLPQYIRRIKAGGLNTRPEITVIRQARAAAVIDGDNGSAASSYPAPSRRRSRWRATMASAGSAPATAIMPAPPRSMPRCRSRTT